MKSEKYQHEKGNDYTTGCSLDYAFFKDTYRLIAIDLNKQKAFNIDPRAIQQLVFNGVVGRAKIIQK